MKNDFVIKNYNKAKPFASFLPGIAGLYGKPMWVFYVNRAQCIASFGTRDKKGAIMEFYPANTAERRVPLEGFRTFIKLKDKGIIYEPFRLPPAGTGGSEALRTLYVSAHEIRIKEISKKHSLKTEVIYFTVPGEGFPALARILRAENLSRRKICLEVIDGMPKLCPFGMNEYFAKHMSRTIEAWMEVEGLAEKQPFYKLKLDASDVSRVERVTSGNFYLSVTDTGKKPDIIIDPACVFGSFGDFTFPENFAKSAFKAPNDQRYKNITPSAFSCCEISLPAGKSASIFSLIGHAESRGKVKRISEKVEKPFFDKKRAENKREVERVSSSVSVFSGIDKFDAYVSQTNLDNALRGGYPIDAPRGEKVIYVFNRKHGDLERDYNNFVLEPEYYSQGNGNFRDANQNRRSSVWLKPSVGEKDIKDFYNLIQLDGFNPLVIKGDIFFIKNGKKRKKLAAKYFGGKDKKETRNLLSGEFTPGSLLNFAEGRKVKKGTKAFFDDTMRTASCRIDAEHREGYWIDHWTYNLDLLESYLALFPEKETQIIFKEKDFLFFDSPYRVKPRRERFIKDKESIRQYDSVYLDKKKKKLIDSRSAERSWVRVKKGKGAVYKCALSTKILAIISNKIASLDPLGRGIEMEADKPGWCDSMNGLPGIAGSSFPETAELLRLVWFFLKATENAGKVAVRLPSRLAHFLRGLARALGKYARCDSARERRAYWEASNNLKEAYREKVRLGLTGREENLDKKEITQFLALAAEKLEDGIRRSRKKNGLPYTYFINDMKNFTAKPVALFLEGPARLLKITKDKTRALSLYRAVKRSDLYDRKLGMYKLNAPLDREPLEIGRSRVFTPGWLENESIWLHMEYKYLLEVLKKGLYEEFYDDFKTALVPFQDQKRYGRSVFENSSFIVSSKFFDKRLHGTGFIARLTGATAEFIHMLRIMNLGENPFALKGRNLIFKPEPVLHWMLFTGKEKKIEFPFSGRKRAVTLAKNSYAFSLFGGTLAIYNNPRAKNTFGRGAARPVKFTLRYKNGRESVIKAPYLEESNSHALREGKIESLLILLK